MKSCVLCLISILLLVLAFPRVVYAVCDGSIGGFCQDWSGTRSFSGFTARQYCGYACPSTQTVSVTCGPSACPNGFGYACTGVCSSGTTATPTSPACFPAGTKISTFDGKKNIETLKTGDKILSFDPATGKTVENEVGEVITAKADVYYLITTASGRQIKATAEHPFYVGENLSLWEKLSKKVRDFIKGD